MDKLAIWSQVAQTDPDFTDKVNFGQFKFTTIDAMYQVLQATKVFGPCGQGWGTRNERFTPIVVDPADPHYTLLCYQAELWYLHEGKEGRQDIAADIELFENTKNGWKRVSDPVKKVRTDALTKGLSWLGFSADVFMGKFDDAKYVAKLQQDKRQQAQAPKPPAQPAGQADQAGTTSKPPLSEMPYPAAENQRQEIDKLRKRLRIPGAQFTEWLEGYGYEWKRLSAPQAKDVIEMLTQQLQDELSRAQKLSEEFEADRAAGKVPA